MVIPVVRDALQPSVSFSTTTPSRSALIFIQLGGHSVVDTYSTTIPAGRHATFSRASGITPANTRSIRTFDIQRSRGRGRTNGTGSTILDCALATRIHMQIINKGFFPEFVDEAAEFCGPYQISRPGIFSETWESASVLMGGGVMSGIYSVSPLHVVDC